MHIPAFKSAFRSATLAAALLGMAMAAAPLAADIAIVTTPSTPVDSLDEQQVRNLWLGETNRIDGVRMTIAERSDAGLRDLFYRLVLHRTRGQMKALRAKRGFQFGTPPPPAFPGDRTLKEWLKSGSNRIGYVDAAAVDETVKVLLIIPTSEEEGP